MNFSSFISYRYLKSNKEQNFLSWITLLSILGIMIGVAAMIVVLAVINGFEKELRQRFLAANAHIVMFRYPAGVENSEIWEREIKKILHGEVTDTSPFIQSETMIRNKNTTHSIFIKGISPDKRENVQPLKKIVRPVEALGKLQDEIEMKKREHSPKIASIIVGVHLLKSMQAKVGDILELISPSSDMEDNPLGNLQLFKVAGVYDSGLQHYDEKIGLISIPSAQKLFNMKKEVTGIEIGLRKPLESKVIAKRINHHFNYDNAKHLSSGYITVKEWQSFNKNIFDAMKTERIMIAIIVALVALVASFNILTTLFISVTQRKWDISLLKSLGANNRQIIALFLKQGGLIGMIGGLLGIFLALGLSWILENYKIIDLPKVYLLAKLPIDYDPLVYAGVTLVCFITSCLAGIYPAYVASKITPIEGLSDLLTK